MELHTKTEDTLASRIILEGQLRECYGRVVYTHKTHEKATDILMSRLSKIKLSQLILSALATGGFLATFFGAGNVGMLLGGFVSSTLLVLNAYTKDYNLGELSQKHRQTGADLWIIREKYLSLLIDLRMEEKQVETLQQERDKLLEALHAVYTGAPSTTQKSYKKAQKALQQQEDMTFSSTEIDALLPKELKRGQDC